MLEQIGRYRVVRPIGSGGMGHVYLAEDPTLERRVAIKLLIRDPQQLGLGEEAKTLAALHHPGIVTIHEIGEHEGRDFIVMEYLEGKTLRDLLVRGKTPRLVLLEICARVADALAAAHRAGVLHRDIKPENILVTDDGTVKVLDFGIAHRFRRAASNVERATVEELAHAFEVATEVDDVTTLASGGTKTQFGTPAYMAPEILQGEPSTEQSDIYSLGITVYECIAGKRPYEPKSLVELIALTIDAPPARLADPLGDLIADMLSHDPSVRPPLIDIAETLDRKHTVPSPPPERTPEPQPRARRRLLIGGAVLGTVAAGALAFVIARSSLSSDPDPPAPGDGPPSDAAVRTISIVVEDVDIPPRLYEIDSPGGGALTTLMTGALARAKPVVIRAKSASLGFKPDYRLRVTIAELRPDRRLAHLELVDAHGKRVLDKDVTGSRTEPYGKLIDAVGLAVATTIAPGATLERGRDAEAAARIYKLGIEQLDKAEFASARALLEEATYHDPDSFESWYALAFVLGWVNADTAAEAADNARRLAPAGSFEAALMDGMVKFHEGDYAGVRTVVTPLLSQAEAAYAADHPKERDPGKKDPARIRAYRETLDLLGEAAWHDGHFAEGYGLFEKIAAIDVNFRPAMIHMRDYALAHHELIKGAQILGLSSPDKDAIKLSAGRYRELLDLKVSDELRIYALAILQQPIAEDSMARLWGTGSTDYDCMELAIALRAGDLKTARALFAASYQRHFSNGKVPSNMLYGLGQFAEVLLVAGLDAELRQVLAVYEKSALHQARHDYYRIAVLSAALLHDPTLIPANPPSYRNDLIVRAVRAELAGDRPKAIALMTSVVKDPSRSMDFPERAMLLRNLRAARKTKEAAQLCKDTLHPFVFRNALLPFQRTCR